MNDPISMINQQHPSVLPYLMLASLLLSIVSPYIVRRWPSLAGPIDWVLHLLSAVPGRVQMTQLSARVARRIPPTPGVGIMMMMLALACCGCGASPKQVASTVLDIGSATCSEIEQQTSTEWIELTCEAISAADGVSKVFRARLRRIDAVALASRSCPEASK